MARHVWQAVVAAVVWSFVFVYAGVPVVLAVLIPVDVALVALALLRWQSVQS